MDRVLEPIPKNEFVVYLDDVLVHAKEFELALGNLKMVMHAIRLGI